MARRPSRGHRATLRPGGVRAQRYPDQVPDDRGATTDRLEGERESQSDWLDKRDQLDAAVQADDPELPQRRRLRTHGDLVYEVALSVEIGRRVEGKGGVLRRSHPSIWVADSRLFGFADPPAARRARALEVDGVLRTHQIQDAFRALPRSGPDAFAAAVRDVCDRRDLRDVGGLTVAEAEAAGRVRYGPPLDVVFAASGTDPALLSAAAAVCREASPVSRFPDQLDRAAQRVAVAHVDLCVRDPYRAVAVERRWELERDGLELEAADAGGANFGAWFERTRRVAEAHYAAGLDPVCEPLPRQAVEAVLGSDGSLRGAVRALGGAAADVHRTARAAHAGFAAVRRLDSWLVDDATLSGVMGSVFEGAGLSWPPADRGAVTDRYGVARAASGAGPSGPVIEQAPPVPDLYAAGRPLTGARWPLDAVTALPLPATEALAVHAWRVRGGIDDAVFVEEAAAVQRGGSVPAGQAGVEVDSGRDGGRRVWFPAAAVGVAGVPGPGDFVSVDQVVQGLGAGVARHASPLALYRAGRDLLVVPDEAEPAERYASTVALAAAQGTGHASREGRRDARAPVGSVGWVREQLRCDLAAAKVVGALGMRYDPPPGIPLPPEAASVFVRHRADVCRDADRMASFVIARARGVELASGYRVEWRVDDEPAVQVAPPEGGARELRDRGTEVSR